MADFSKRTRTTIGFLLSMLLVSCSIQKRTLRPGFHVERIGALNKQSSLQVQAQETANLLVLPNESVGLSFTPPATEAFAEDAENLDKLEDLAGLAAVIPPQSIESGSVQRELSPMRSDSTDAISVESQVSPSDEAELLAKIAKAKKARKTFIWLAILSCPLILTIPFFLFFAGWKKSQLTALQKEAKLPFELAWYSTDWFWISLILYPIFPFALACRLIDLRRVENGEEPLSWKSKTIFFTLFFFFALLLLGGGPSYDFSSFSFRF